MSSKGKRFESLLEAVPDALVGMNQKGVIRFVNRQTESLFGFDRDDLIGRPIDTLLPDPLWQVYAHHREDYFADPRSRSSGLELELSGLDRLLPLVHLAHRRDHQQDVPGVDVGHADVDRELGAIGVPSAQHQIESTGTGPGVSEVVLLVLCVDLPKRLGLQRLDGLADQLVTVIAEQRLRLLVDKPDHALLIHPHQGVRHSLQ